jgi:hypothetical protein
MFQLSPPRDAKVDQRWLNTGGNMDVLGTMDAVVQVCERRTTAPLPTLLTARHPQDTAHSTHMRALVVPPTAMFASPVRREPCTGRITRASGEADAADVKPGAAADGRPLGSLPVLEGRTDGIIRVTE